MPLFSRQMLSRSVVDVSELNRCEVVDRRWTIFTAKIPSHVSIDAGRLDSIFRLGKLLGVVDFTCRDGRRASSSYGNDQRASTTSMRSASTATTGVDAANASARAIPLYYPEGGWGSRCAGPAVWWKARRRRLVHPAAVAAAGPTCLAPYCPVLGQ